jgi:ubiquinone/menaquinone biosynthesis C-methylase UbiE
MTKTSPATDRRRLLLPEMEGVTARWYDRQRGTPSQIAAWREEAARLTTDQPAGASVLEVAPGPGYLAIEIARSGRFHVTGLDISETMVSIARQHATEAAVDVDFRQGDVAAMPFEAGSFDLIVCQAAFKNFRRPVDSLNELHRVLRPGGKAVIQDLRKDASSADIDQEVKRQRLGGIGGFVTRRILGALRKRAYTGAQFEGLVAGSAFRTGEVETDGIGLEVRLSR